MKTVVIGFEVADNIRADILIVTIDKMIKEGTGPISAQGETALNAVSSVQLIGNGSVTTPDSTPVMGHKCDFSCNHEVLNAEAVVNAARPKDVSDPKVQDAHRSNLILKQMDEMRSQLASVQAILIDRIREHISEGNLERADELLLGLRKNLAG